MANEEKLAKFHQAINHYALEQRQKIEEEVADFKKKELQEAEDEVLVESYHLIQKEMEAETVDYIEWKTGTRVEGIMLSIMSFTGKIENTFSSSIGLAILGFTGYVQHTEGSLIQNTETNWALFLLTTLVPAIGYLLMLIPMHFYNITGDGHRQMMKEIMERRAARKAEKETAKAVNE